MLLLLLACGPEASPIDADGDRYFADEDCDDADPAVNPGIPEIPYNGVDDDCDAATPDDDLDGDGFPAASDCDDEDAAARPVAETCNGLDDDCDGSIDEEATDTRLVYQDGDGDGFGSGEGTLSCDIPVGTSLLTDDCDDTRSTVFPGAVETCDGWDEDCDGLIDEELSTVSGWADVDGDGHGDPAAWVEGCDTGLSVSADSDDCDDADPQVYSGATERQDGHDDDCDGVVDEPVVLLVIGYQCQVWGDEGWVNEKTAITTYLKDLKLGWEEVEEDGSATSDEAQVGGYALALFNKCGRAWEDYNQDMVDAFNKARKSGTATLLFDDDVAWLLDSVIGGENLVLLENAPSNGSYSSSASPDTSSTHPAFDGPYGRPKSFTYNWDMDRTSGLGVGETTLGTHSGGYPWWVVNEDSSTGVRSASIVASLWECNEGEVGSGAQAQLEIVFKNTVAWLLRL